MIRLVAIFALLSVAANLKAGTDQQTQAMEAARDALYSSHGGTIVSKLLIERFEHLHNEGDSVSILEAQGWIGGDLHKLWLKTEGEYFWDESELEEFEIQALYSRAVHPFWDFQVGLRHDVRPQLSRNYAVVGFQGTAPYWFELDASLFISDEGDASARVETEYELLLTQRLVLQPRLEINVALSDDAPTGIGSGLSTAQAGLRLRYEFTRQIALYTGVSRKRAFGDTVGLLGEEGDAAFFLIGVSAWF